jgi:hypothetical protein
MYCVANKTDGPVDPAASNSAVSCSRVPGIRTQYLIEMAGPALSLSNIAPAVIVHKHLNHHWQQSSDRMKEPNFARHWAQPSVHQLELANVHSHLEERVQERLVQLLGLDEEPSGTDNQRSDVVGTSYAKTIASSMQSVR